MKYHIDRSLTQLQLLQELQQQTFIECFAHNLILIGQSIWADRTIYPSQRQVFIHTLNQIHQAIFGDAGEQLSHRRLGDLLTSAVNQSPQLSEFILEAIEESYQTALVA